LFQDAEVLSKLRPRVLQPRPSTSFTVEKFSFVVMLSRAIPPVL
jgi:hypothetical protein